MLEARRLLAQRREQQCFFVPLGDGGVKTGRNDDLAAESGLQRRVAADVIGMRVRVYEPFQVSTAHGMINQFDGLGSMRDVAAIDHCGIAAVEEDDAVGRKPAALENEQRLRQVNTHSGLSGSLVVGRGVLVRVTTSV